MVISWVSSFPQKEQMLTIADEGARGGGEVVNQKLNIGNVFMAKIKGVQ